MAGTPEKTTGAVAAIFVWVVDFPIYRVTESVKLILNDEVIGKYGKSAD